MDFNAFALSHLPPPPARVIEVGCGKTGELALSLHAAGYDVLAIDPRAPEGPIFRRVTLDQLAEPGSFDAAVAARVLHHVDPLEPAVEKLAVLAPLLLVDEFAWDRLDPPTQEWYEGQHRILTIAGAAPGGPADFDAWREEHADLHPSGTVREALATRFDERLYQDRPYLYRWLQGQSSEALEEALIAADAIRPLGYRCLLERRSSEFVRPSPTPASGCGPGTRAGRTA